jgi:hypothetical protein
LIYTDTSAAPNQAEVFLDADSGGLPGSTIESWSLSNLPAGSCGGACPLTVVTSIAKPTLIVGHQYWIVATGGMHTFDNWLLTLYGYSFGPSAGRSIVDRTDSGWVLSSPPLGSPEGAREGAVEVFGDPVPEPGTFALTIFGLITIVVWRLHARQEHRDYPNAPASANSSTHS